MSNILEIQGLKVMYGKSVAIHDVNISVPQGGIVTLIGSNGAGKSTTLNTVLGLVPATAGKIMFNGEDITHNQKNAPGRAKLLWRTLWIIWKTPYCVENSGG